MAKKQSAIHRATLLAGFPERSSSLYREIRFLVGDPAALVILPGKNGGMERLLIVRDIEMERARTQARVDRVACPADFTPNKGLSGDREEATAQAVAECCRRAKVVEVRTDRSLPLIYAGLLTEAGIEIECDLHLGVDDRRRKDAQEQQWIREAQAVTEAAVRSACRMIARARADERGVLLHAGKPLTSERVKQSVDLFLLKRGYTHQGCIVAGGRQGSDCHAAGSGVLKTGEPVIVDIFPQNRATRYHGDCTRTVVHGKVSPKLRKMVEAVKAAHAAGMNTVRAGVSGEEVHRAVVASLEASGYAYRAASETIDPKEIVMTHGTGHGIGLEVHEAPLLAEKGPELLIGDVVSIEPGLYGRSVGGIRLEDLVIVTENGCQNPGRLPYELDWSS